MRGLKLVGWLIVAVLAAVGVYALWFFRQLRGL